MEQNNNVQNPTAGEKTFTQDDVNRIVGERLAEAKTRSEKELVQREQELTTRELQITARETLQSKGLPLELAEVLNCKDAETLEKSITILEQSFTDKVEETTTALQETKLPVKGAKPVESICRGWDNPQPDRHVREAMGL